jgi:hypothetical protein
MQVDTAALRKAADQLRHDVITQLEPGYRAVDVAPPAATFCQYAGPGPWDEAAQAWRQELDAIRQASLQLADALTAAADDYDRADAAAASRLVAPR